MAKKKSNYMSEKRFSLNDLIIGSCLLCFVVFFAFCLFSVNLFANAEDEVQVVSFDKEKESSGVTKKDIFNFYGEKINEVASTMSYGDNLYYTIVDINRDSIDDLVLKYISLDGSMEYLFYTFDPQSYAYSTDSIVYAGSISSNNCTLYQLSEDSFLIGVGDYNYYIYLDRNVITTFPVLLSDYPILGSALSFVDYTDNSLLK